MEVLLPYKRVTNCMYHRCNITFYTLLFTHTAFFISRVLFTHLYSPTLPSLFRVLFTHFYSPTPPSLFPGYIPLHAVAGWVSGVLRRIVRCATSSMSVWVPAPWNTGHSQRWTGWWISKVWKTQEKTGTVLHYITSLQYL